MKKISKIKILQILCILTAILWAILAILSISRGSSVYIPIIMFGSVILEILFAFLLKNNKKFVLWIFLSFTVFNLILTITDQMGLWDYIFLILYLSKIIITAISIDTLTTKHIQ